MNRHRFLNVGLRQIIVSQRISPHTVKNQTLNSKLKKNLFVLFSIFLHRPSLKAPNNHHGRFITTGETSLSFFSSSTLKSQNNLYERSIGTVGKEPLIDSND